MWADGETFEAIGRRFGVATSTISRWAQQYKLPARPKPMKTRSADPSLEEIERLKAKLRAKHMAERLAETDDASSKRASHQRRAARFA
jgi:transposase